jgi:DNA polymerase III delta subunit
LLNDLYESEKSLALKLIGALNRNLRMLIAYKDQTQQMLPKEKITKGLFDGKGFLQKKLESNLRLWEMKDLRSLVKNLRRLDRDLKLGGPARVGIAGLLFL